MSTGPAPRRRRKTQSKAKPQPNTYPNVFSVPVPRSGASKAYDATAELEEKIEKLEKNRKTERLIWIISLILVCDLFSYKSLINSAPVFTLIFFIELVFLCIVGKFLENEYAVMLCERIFSYLCKNQGKPSEE